jgi:hypothetical protein
MGDYRFVPYRPGQRSPLGVVERGEGFYDEMDKRRRVRMVGDDPVPGEAIEFAVRPAPTAPSGAQQQPRIKCDRPYMDIVPWIVVGFDQIHLYNEESSSKKH